MRDVEKRMAASDVALCWLRISGCLMLMSVHGLPKLLHFQRELGLIEDPFGIGSGLTLSLAIFAEVLRISIMPSGEQNAAWQVTIRLGVAASSAVRRGSDSTTSRPAHTNWAVRATSPSSTP